MFFRNVSWPVGCVFNTESNDGAKMSGHAEVGVVKAEKVIITDGMMKDLYEEILDNTAKDRAKINEMMHDFTAIVKAEADAEAAAKHSQTV